MLSQRDKLEYMKSNPKILVLVTHGLYEPWISILNEGQRRTWLTWPMPNQMQVMHFHGTPLSRFGQLLDRIHEMLRWKNRWISYLLAVCDRVITFPLRSYIPRISDSEMLKIEQCALHVHFPDSYLTYRWKLLSVLRYFLEETDYDFVFFTTTSSLIVPHKLERAISMFDSSEFIYAGVKPYTGANFAAGNNRLLSRSAAKLVLDNRWRLDPAIIEDKALGDLFQKLNVAFIELPSLNVQSVEILESPEIEEQLRFNFHVRVKSGSLKLRNDVDIMKSVFDKLNNWERFDER